MTERKRGCWKVKYLVDGKKSVVKDKYVHDDQMSLRGKAPFPCSRCDPEWCKKCHRHLMNKAKAKAATAAAAGGDSDVDVAPISVHTLGVPWNELLTAARDVFTANQTVTVWYSFMQSGNTVEDDPGPGISTVTIEGTSPVVSHTDFGNELTACLTEWKNLFEALFSQTLSEYTFTVNFVRRDASGDEQGTLVPSSVFDAPYSLIAGDGLTDLVGDLRISMIPIDGPSSVLAYAYSPGGALNVSGEVGGDSRYDSQESWRLDSTSIANTISIKMVGVHEFGHNIGMGHDPNPNSIMYAFLPPASQNFSNKFPSGLVGSPLDKFSLNAVYSGQIAVWATDKNYRPHIRAAVSVNSPSGSSWASILSPAQFGEISCGANGRIWGIRRSVKTAFIRTGITSQVKEGDGWSAIPGQLLQICTGFNGRLWAVSGVTRRALYRTGITTSDPVGTTWNAADNKKVRVVQIGPYGSVWGLDSLGRVIFRVGVTLGNQQGTYWLTLSSSSFKKLSVGYQNELWGLLSDGRIRRRTGISEALPQGKSWEAIGTGRVRDIAIGPMGFVWCVTNDFRVLRRTQVTGLNPSGASWVRITGLSARTIAVGYFLPANTSSP